MWRLGGGGSDHGGSSSTLPASLDVLRRCPAVGGRLEVYLDGGCAEAGRGDRAGPWAGEGSSAGPTCTRSRQRRGRVRRALELLSVEMRNAMTLLGTPELGSVTRYSRVTGAHQAGSSPDDLCAWVAGRAFRKRTVRGRL